jgi:hypothetical protein
VQANPDYSVGPLANSLSYDIVVNVLDVATICRKLAGILAAALPGFFQRICPFFVLFYVVGKGMCLSHHLSIFVLGQESLLLHYVLLHMLLTLSELEKWLLI